MTYEKENCPDGDISDEAMAAAIEIELLIARGSYAAVTFGRAIQKAIDTALEDCEEKLEDIRASNEDHLDE